MSAPLRIEGGFTAGAFPDVVEFLLKDEAHELALLHAAQTKKVDIYQSLVDFLFCEIYTEHRLPCIQFYERKKPNLAIAVSTDEITAWEKTLMKALTLAVENRRARRRVYWTKFRITALRPAG